MWPHLRFVGLAFAAPLTVAACTSETAPAAGPSVRDSLGVVIVEHSSIVLDSTWKKLGDPILEIGEVDGEEPFLFRLVTAGVLLDDSTFGVLNRGSREIRFFDINGNHVVTAGRRGDGPGEMRVPSGLVSMDGLVGVYDLERLSWFSQTGEFIRIDTRDLSKMQSLASGTMRVGEPRLLKNGAWVSLATEDLAGSPPPVWTPMSTLIWIPRDLSRIDTLLVGPAGKMVQSAGTSAWVPFYPQMVSDIGMDRSTIVGTTNESFELQYFDSEGAPTRIVRIAADPDLLLDSDIRAWQDTQRAAARGTDREERVERGLAELPYPEVLPVFRSLHMDQLGRTWAERYDADPAIPRFLVIDPEGAVLGHVALPPRFTILDANELHLLGVYRDEFDVEYVQLFALK